MINKGVFACQHRVESRDGGGRTYVVFERSWLGERWSLGLGDFMDLIWFLILSKIVVFEMKWFGFLNRLMFFLPP